MRLRDRLRLRAGIRLGLRAGARNGLGLRLLVQCRQTHCREAHLPVECPPQRFLDEDLLLRVSLDTDGQRGGGAAGVVVGAHLELSLGGG